MIHLPEDASHEYIDTAIRDAKAYALAHGCKDLWWEGVDETIAYDWTTYRMKLFATINGVDTVLLVGPLIKRPRKKPMTQPTLDFTKPIINGRGDVVQILVRDLKNDEYPMAGVVNDKDGFQHVEAYTSEGLLYVGMTDEGDLRNAPEYEYKLVYEDGVTCPAGTIWFKNKTTDARTYDFPGRVGWLVRQVGSTKAVFEPI